MPIYEDSPALRDLQTRLAENDDTRRNALANAAAALAAGNEHLAQQLTAATETLSQEHAVLREELRKHEIRG